MVGQCKEAGVVRALEYKDLPQIWDLVKKTYDSAVFPLGGTWTASLLKQELNDGFSLGQFDEYGLSSVILFRRHDLAAEITFLATHPDRRRKGEMQYLLEFLLQRLASKESLWLEVHEKNTPALTMYEKLGFQQVGQRPAYYRDGGAAVLFTYRRPD